MARLATARSSSCRWKTAFASEPASADPRRSDQHIQRCLGMIRAVIFDFNGVLVDDEPAHFALFREILAQEGIDLTEGEYQDEYLGYDDRGCFEAALSR